MAISLYQSEYEALRALLRDERLKAGLTQSQMAQALAVGQSYVSKLERGENFIDVLTYIAWCNACGLAAGSTLDGFIRKLPKKAALRR